VASMNAAPRLHESCLVIIRYPGMGVLRNGVLSMVCSSLVAAALLDPYHRGRITRSLNCIQRTRALSRFLPLMGRPQRPSRWPMNGCVLNAMCMFNLLKKILRATLMYTLHMCAIHYMTLKLPSVRGPPKLTQSRRKLAFLVGFELTFISHGMTKAFR
jgi:hypothetical protein